MGYFKLKIINSKQTNVTGMKFERSSLFKQIHKNTKRNI